MKVVDDCVASVPDPGSSAPVQICYSLFKPAGASRRHPVPMIWHSHGWGGSRTTDPAAFATFLDGGYGVLSFDQRGFGESGGHAYVENPAVEGKDVARLIRVMSRLRWVRQDGPGDPRLGAIGGSYGGGYQFLAAFTSLQRRGTPVLDAMAPEITWNDLNESLAPEGVVRTAWAAALSAASLPTDALPPRVYKALAEGAATGTWPDGSIPGTEDMPRFFRRNGPAFHVARGRRLDIPVLFGQGTTDSLFPLQQGLANWQDAITPRARRRSIFVAYNGGHVLPGAAAARDLGHLRPVLDAAGRRRLRGAQPALLRRAAQAPPDRAARLRPAPPRHPRLDVHHDRLARPDHHGAGRHRGQPDGGRGAARLRDRRRAAAGGRYAAPHRPADGARAAQPGLLRPGRGHQPGRRHAGPEQRAAGRRAGPRGRARSGASRCRRWPSTCRPASGST